MSIALMSKVWRLDLPPSDKMVLLALADAANDDGVTWMALESKEGVKLDLLKKTSLSRRAVQGALKRLCDAGYLARVDRPGKGVIWTVKGCSTCTPRDEAVEQTRGAARAPRGAGDAPGGAAGAPKPSTNPQFTSEAKASSVGETDPSATGVMVLSADQPSPMTKRKPKAQRFVPDDWEPTPSHIAKAADLGIDLNLQIDLFRNHEFKDPKQDFDRAFHRWIRNAPTFAQRFPDRARRGPAGWGGQTALDLAAEAMTWREDPAQ